MGSHTPALEELISIAEGWMSLCEELLKGEAKVILITMLRIIKCLSVAKSALVGFTDRAQINGTSKR